MTDHPTLVVLGYLTILVYCPTACFVSSYKDSAKIKKSDVNFAPRFLAIERISKFILVYFGALQIHAGQSSQSKALDFTMLSLLFAVIATIIIGLSITPPQSSVVVVSRIRKCSLLGIAWAAFTGLVATILDDPHFPILEMLLWGWAALIVMDILAVGYFCFRPTRLHETSERVLRIDTENNRKVLNLKEDGFRTGVLFKDNITGNISR